MPKMVGQEWGQYDFEYSPHTRQPEFDTKLSSVVSHLLGWFPGSKKFIRLLCDTDGRLLVTTGSSKVSIASTSAVVVGAVDVTLLADNPNRRSYAIKNLGPNTIYLGFGSVASSVTGYPVLVNQEFADDSFTGVLHAISTAGSNDVRVLEL